MLIQALWLVVMMLCTRWGGRLPRSLSFKAHHSALISRTARLLKNLALQSFKLSRSGRGTKRSTSADAALQSMAEIFF